jgi:hypothetical protein
MTSITEDEAREILGVTAATPFVSVTAQGIIIASGYSEALARLLRWVPKASWRPDKRAWLVPLAGADAVRSVLPEIIRLAEAAFEERREEKAAAGTAVGKAFDKQRLIALGEAAGRCVQEVTALTGSAPPAIDRGNMKDAIAALRGEATRLSAAADQLEAWLMAQSHGKAE